MDRTPAAPLLYALQDPVILFLRPGSDNIVNVTPNPPIVCQSGYRGFWYGCYKKHRETLSWDAAKTRCASEGSFLVTIIAGPWRSVFRARAGGVVLARSSVSRPWFEFYSEVTNSICSV